MHARGPRTVGADRDARAPWLTDSEQTVWRAYLRGSRLLTEALEHDLQPHGVSLSEYEILALLSEAPGEGMRMSVLAEIVVYSRSRLSHTAMRLERRGYVRRERIPGDRRGVGLCLTPRGHDLILRLAPVHVRGVRAHLIDLLDPAQLRTLGHVMTRVQEAIEAGESPETEAPQTPETPEPDQPQRAAGSA